MRSPSPELVGEVAVEDGGVVIRFGESVVERRMPFLFGVIDAAGTVEPIPAGTHARRADGAFSTAGAGAGFTAEARWSPPGSAGLRAVELDVTCTDPRGRRDAGLVVALLLGPTETPRWLIPGLFYGENRPEGCRVVFPRFAARPSAGDPFESDRWSFRSDRAATPAVFGWDDVGSASLSTAERSDLGLTGIGFVGGRARTELRLLFPYREEPVGYDGSSTPRPPDVPGKEWRAGEAVTLRFQVGVAGPHPHSYAPVLRELHGEAAARSPMSPWVAATEAARLAAEGLVRWHYDASNAALLETAAFEREGEAAGQTRGDRRAMHVGWLSGAVPAYALLADGRATRDGSSTAAGAAVLDSIAGNLAPAGTFWGQWTADGGWGKGWTPGEDRLHARTLAEATLFLTRAIGLDRHGPNARPAWSSAVASNLDFIAARQRDDGALGSAYHGRSGAVESWDGAAGMAWIPALVEGARVLGRPELDEVARRAGSYYRQFVDAEFIHGAPEDVDLAPTSEDGYVAVMSYVALAESAGRGDAAFDDWLDIARRAADWMLTFRYTYNVEFSPSTLLGAYGYATRGADQASVANQHLHTYGLVCLPELVRLSRLTGDGHYLDRARESFAAARQFIAREDGDFNARRGMAPERFLQTACFGPKGSIGALSHAWCLGLLLYAATEATMTPELAEDRSMADATAGTSHPPLNRARSTGGGDRWPR
jgi:hypothetical protein